LPTDIGENNMGRKRELNITLTRDAIRKILKVGHELDVNKNGLFDARSGCVNIWCSPEDKPSCWPKEIMQGGLDYPRDYVAGIYWEWNDKDQAELVVEVEPYELERSRGLDRWVHSLFWVHPLSRKSDRPKEISEDEWEELFRWSVEKVHHLLSVSGIRLSA